MKKALFLLFLILRIADSATAASPATNGWGQPPQNLNNRRAQQLSVYQRQGVPLSKEQQVIPPQYIPPAFATETTPFGVAVQPVTGNCLEYAAKRFGVPIEALFLVLDIERGNVGKISYNKNGSYDMGPMQINSCHLETFQQAGISRDMILYNGCINILAGAYLLFGHAKSVKTDNWLEIIGRYHSRTPEKKAKYQAAAIKRWNQMENDAALKILNRANGF